MAALAARYAENPYYREYEQLLLELHRLFREGKDDSPEAESIRDRMEAPETHLARDEVQRLKGLSGDLYQIGQDEIFERVTDQSKARSLAQELRQAVELERWDEVLALLRHRPAEAPGAVVAALRARAYEALGHSASAALFREFALRLGSRTVNAAEVADSVYGPAIDGAIWDGGPLALSMLLAPAQDRSPELVSSGAA